MGESSRPDSDIEAEAGQREPRSLLPTVPLAAGERRQVWLASSAPVLVLAAVLVPFALFGASTWTNVLGSALLYGGLLGLAAGFVTVDRLHGRQCPACRERNAAGTTTCGGCGYDLAARPGFACSERHGLRLDPGLCDCGRRLQLLPSTGGIGSELKVMLRVGAWLLAFLMGMGVLFRLAAG